ncbi:MAG: ATP-dependent zinc metalloprotease FtsH, partial [Planctomycetia bacterium]
MAKKRDVPKRSPERRPAGGSLVWSLVAAGVAGLFAMNLIVSTPDLELSLTDFERLVAASDDPDEEARWIGVRSAGEPPRAVRYGGLADVKIGTYQITGSVRERPLGGEPEAGKEPGPDSGIVKPGGGSDSRAAVRRFRTAKSPSGQADVDLESRLRRHAVPFSHEGAPSPWRNWLPMLLVTGLFGLAFYLMMRRLGGAGSPMAFGRSRGKMYAQEDLGITFDDVAGIEEAVEELREVVEFLRSPEKYQVLGGHIPKGVLLVGPPGTGKTLLAKAIAGEAGVPFFGLSGSDFVEMFVGVGAARVRDMFQQAAAKSPCIIFIDELDALGKTRGTSVVGGHDEREQTLNQILSEMDGFSPSESVIILAATNRPDVLDPALLRPGRFDRHVTVDRPNQKARLELFKVHTRNVPLSPDVDLERLAGATVGLTGADIRNLVNEAALWATRHDKNAVDSSDFDYARDKVLMGPKREEVLAGREKKMTAYHEAGHALGAWLLPGVDKLHKVTIIPRGRALGVTQLVPEEDRMNIGESD